MSFRIVTPPARWWRKIAEFDKTNFGVDAWPTAMWEYELESAGRSYRAVVSEPGPIRAEGTLVGVGGVSHGPEAEILTIAISEHVRGRGLGRHLLDELLAIAWRQGAEAIFLEVRANDAGAQGFYERAGFVPVGLRKNYYRNANAVIMRLDR